jgi:phosphatidylethanolamine/phosphatidyl-N-methylethanolamine N-methyltransferase
MSRIFKIEPDFISAWLRNPRQIGAVLPSSGGLTQAMAAQINRNHGLTVELGAGTGAVTSALLSRGVTPERLILVEKDKILAQKLAHHFPKLRVLQGDAAHLPKLLKDSHLGLVDNVVSSLPLLSMRSHTRIRILAQIFNSLHPDGKLVQFTYSPRAPIPKSLATSLKVEGIRMKRILFNVPPAHVWVYKRIPSLLKKPRTGIKRADYHHTRMSHRKIK